jgi:hypothetical protein
MAPRTGCQNEYTKPDENSRARSIVHHPEADVSEYGASTSVLLRGIAELLHWKGQMQQQQQQIMTTLSSVEETV